ncbi:uncharacterized protein LOC116265847 isoform X2 [Nymphaea colorata]|uniref:uncharacterized protein LOC116265847 isoform X2 n=1 Tax=Nymphaea colorata TaxID=210225 RepID=UPI00129DAB10|nr:uncharacterized protein LOC116265847 isoform X2 [Nymphaea colorata]
MPSSRGRKKSEVQHGVKSIGCMSGIFYLLQGHRLDQKRLTQAAKPDRILTSNTSQFKEIVTTHFSSNAEKQKKIRSKKQEPKSPAAPASDPRRLSCNNPRSPTLPAEMRRQSSEMSGKEKLHRQPGVVARLMGLQDFPDAVVRRPDPQETTSEKRRRILGALEKCEEDLHTLKKIIEAIHVVEKCGRKPVMPVAAPPKVVVEMNLKGGGGGSWLKAEHCKFPTSPTARSPLHGRRCIEPNSDQPSPVSVLDDSAFFSHDELTPVKNKEVSQEAKETGSSNLFPILKESDKYQRLVADAYAKPCEAAGAGDSSGGAPRKAPYVTAIEEEELTEVMQQSAKKEGVELERIGMMLEAHVFGALLEETVSELGVSWRPASSMAFLRCRKRLYF